ncbi:MAG: esterase, partial [Clostridiaceae bacterium]|nr:esterase [Clostridiaceae bacterium]
MRNLKKLLAVVVAICVLATMTIPAFAAETKTDAQIVEALGVLKGDGAGVTDTYLAKGTNRMQAAQLYLRLIGLEDEALAELSTDNFDDADLVYAGGQRILAYLKANPDLGWNGVGGNKFEPTGAASAQMIYKVMLEAMGYKQGVDFEWADVLTFAADKGLSKIADVTNLTNNDMATALVEALNAKVKDSDTTLAAKLVADGV